MNGGFYPRDCVARLYVPRKDEGRGLISVEDCVNQAKRKNSGGMGMRIEKQLPALKLGEQLKIFKTRKKSRYMDSLRDRVKNK